ncbi:MAG: ribonuclease Z [Polyangiaceae bacterium]|nr:ribonuclease Z [Polyangiaceae bacterium]
MSLRELVVLGTSSQVPTRHRNHNGYLLRWDDEGFLFDPGEGTQRQMTFAEVPASAISRVFITHFHGDHCLGLAGTVQRLSLDRVPRPVTVHYPESGQVYYERLRHASIFHDAIEIRSAPVSEQHAGLQPIAETKTYRVFAARLDHSVPTFGYRIEERSGRTFLPERLAELGVQGPHVGELSRRGEVTIGDRRVTVDEVSVEREGAAFAFVMDTRPCDNAVALARGADLLVMEATYTGADAEIAHAHAHSTSVDAANTALRAGSRRLAITHFSQRYVSTDQHLAEARAIFPETIAVKDLDRVGGWARRRAGG